MLCTSSRSSSLGTGNWIPFFLSSMYTSATPWSSGSWEKAWAQDWRSERTWRRAGNYWYCLPSRLTFVWISGPGSSCGEITRERRKSENSREHTRMVNCFLQFLTQDSRTVRVRMVDLWDLPALSSSRFLMARTAWSGPWLLELTRSQIARLASQFSEIRCSSVASRSWKQDQGNNIEMSIVTVSPQLEQCLLNLSSVIDKQ